MKKPDITIRFGASHDDITVDGHTFVRHKLARKDFSYLRNVVIDTLVKVRVVSRKAR